MQINLNKINFIYHSGKTFEEMKKLKVLRPFSDEVCQFLNDLSKMIMSDKEAKDYPDIITFAFFCRRSNIDKLKKEYKDILFDNIGRGISFHIAPSNVPINFAYSLVVGLLSGNICIVRSSSKKFKQTQIVCRLIDQVFKNKNSFIKDYICILKYERDYEINSYFSSICDSRIIWGGDNSIKEIRKASIPPRSIDIAFADRYSISIINAEAIINSSELYKLVKDFYNDTYLYDQNACSSPRLIFWLGDDRTVDKAKKILWNKIYEFIKDKYLIEPVSTVEKLLTECRCAIYMKDINIENSEDNLISRINLKHLIKEISDFRCPCGSFLEYNDVNIEKLSKIITNKYQTISYYGIEANEIREWVFGNGLTGVDRIVPIGKALDFSLIWDGYDLIRILSRTCTAI